MLSFKAINRVLQNVLQVHKPEAGVTSLGQLDHLHLPTHPDTQLFCGFFAGTWVGACQLLCHVQQACYILH